MKNYTEFLNERKEHKLNAKDRNELDDFLNYVIINMEEQPNLLRAAYARIQGVLSEIRKGNVTKDQLSMLLHVIYMFIEGNRNADDIREWSEKLMKIDSENYDTLLSIIHEYNQLKHRGKDKFGKIDDQTVFDIKAWLFEKDGLMPVEESLKDDDNIQRLFMSPELTWNEKQELKFQLPRKSMKDIKDNRDWKSGDIMFDGYSHYLVSESCEEFCDFGCGYISTYLDNNPDIDEEEFGEYVTQHNKADRDMGELQDVSKEEIERLGKDFKDKLIKEEYSAHLFYLNNVDELFKAQGYDDTGASIMKKLAIRHFKSGGDDAVIEFLVKTLGVEVFCVSKGKYSFDLY